MFKKTIIILAIIISLPFFIGCDDSNSDPTNTVDSFMTAEVDGQAWESATIQLIYVYTVAQNYLFISGAVSMDAEIITMQIFDFPGTTGTYPLGTDEYETHCFYSPTTEKSYFTLEDEPAAKGTLTINSIDADRIKGTFQFTGQEQDGPETVSITNGEFDIKMSDIIGVK